MSRQDRALRGASRPSVVNIVYRLQRSLPFNSDLNAYVLADRKILDEAAAHILQLEEVIRLLKERTNAPPQS